MKSPWLPPTGPGRSITQALVEQQATLQLVPMRELELLQHICQSAAAPSARIPIPPGDDMAMIDFDGRPILAGVDQVVCGRHFDPKTTPALIGRKAIARSLSDVAAMAARPAATLAAATLPPDYGDERANELFDAMRSTADRYACPLIGGDIALGNPGSALLCTVTVLAEPGPAGAVRRSGAREGDVVYVTGALGGSLRDDGGGRHLTFEPRLAEAIELAETIGERLHAMIDLSDGLGLDASRLAERSGVRIEIDAGRVPSADGVGWRRALGDGEDYELCFAAAGEVPGSLGGLAVTAVGRVLAAAAGEPLVMVRDETGVVDASHLGWEHRS